MPDAYEIPAGVFVRGLENLRAQLVKAEAHVAASGGGEAALLNARLDPGERTGDGGNDSPRDLHRYTLAAQVHWAAEGARLAIAKLLGRSAVPTGSDAQSFADLYRRLDATIAQLREVAAPDLAAGFEREVVIEHPRGTTRSSGSRFLLAYAIPHFFYHVTAAHGILRNMGVPLTMGDFLGRWGTS